MSELGFDAADERPGKVYDARLVRRLWPNIRPQRGWIVLTLAILVATSGAALGLVWTVKLAIDEHFATRDLTGLTPLLAVFALLAAFEVGTRAAQACAVEKAGQDARFALCKDLFRHRQRLTASSYDRTPIRRLVGRVTTNVEAPQEMFSGGVVTIPGDLVFIVGTVPRRLLVRVPQPRPQSPR